ncbi:DUF4328 domain-containing protein [Glaesserella parasuis]|uniref:DUF4328 domain-containing protein n=1 Tax=Glaesserella parasuis TaxID=738 RepID=UPI001366496D|nr:DUF4328 domain-containing protein [Glaesserella parasuis]MCT8823907.1 DUF4328 domain-containing protein [Glaesserella parasuis]MDG6409874.1 DUF4328 domain-containing protein [Glaesserella parasuis]MDG6450620.1 DUF4328 domain-containing protein [Glaesserella parasuis]MDO9780990.1 DUF4328 domain-containing protein [Glaesserella parasuis]MDO9791671.1 DUF4328 domain-containing protein [Glaesserella parasuis]
MLKNKYLTKICLSLLALVFATELFSFVILAYTKIFLNRIENNSITDAELSFSDWIARYGDKIDGFSFLILLLFGIVYLVWLYKAHVNLSILGAKNLRYSHASVVWWWFIPIASLWKPYSAFKEVIIQSQQLAFGSVQSTKFGVFLLIWWLLTFPSSILGPIIIKIGESHTLNGYHFLLNAKLVLYVFEITLSILLFYLIYNVDKWQKKANQSKPISLQKSY